MWVMRPELKRQWQEWKKGTHEWHYTVGSDEGLEDEARGEMSLQAGWVLLTWEWGLQGRPRFQPKTMIDLECLFTAFWRVPKEFGRRAICLLIACTCHNLVSLEEWQTFFHLTLVECKLFTLYWRRSILGEYIKWETEIMWVNLLGSFILRKLVCIYNCFSLLLQYLLRTHCVTVCRSPRDSIIVSLN